MTNAAISETRERAEQIYQTVVDAYTEVGLDAGMLADELLSAEDIVSLLEAGEAPRKVLQAGGGAGVSTLVLALAFPDARVFRVDPDLPVSGTGRRGGAEITRRAAELAGVANRIQLVQGGFSETPTRRSVIDAELRNDRVVARMAGPELCASEQPFDLAYIDGLTSADSRASDIRLAASALTPEGVIVSTQSVGPRGETVRAGVFEFLRYYPDYTFAHDRLDDPQRSLGFLKRRAAGWAGGRAPAPAQDAPEAPMEVRDKLADLVALTVGRRPILEVAIASPVLGAAFRVRGLASRTLRLTGTDWNTHFFDPVIDQICNALDHAPDSVLFSSDLMDYAPDEFVGRLFARLEDRRSQALFFATPPGEAGVAGPSSRPVARIVDLAASQNVKAYAPAALEFERARHEGAGRPGWLGGVSRYASFLMFARGAPGRDARGRNIPEVTPQAVLVREQVELQRIWSEAVLQRSLGDANSRRVSAETERDDALSRWREAAQAIEPERANAERSMVSLRSELQRVRADLSDLAQQKLEAETAAKNADARRRDLEAAREEAEGALRAEVSQLRADLANLQDAHEAVSTALDDSKRLAAEAVAANTRRVSELEARLRNSETERERLVRERDEADTARIAAEASREEVELDLGARLRRADAALVELQQVEPARIEDPNELAALREKLEAAESARRALSGELEDLRSFHEAEVSRRDASMEEMRIQLSAESLRVVDAACRDVDTRARLDGVANHLALTHDALRRFRDNPDAFLADDVPYPIHEQGLSEHDENVVARASELHGRAADLSRDVAIELERLAKDRADYLEWKTRQLEINETSHEEALRIAHEEFSTRYWAQERLNTRIAAGLALNNRLLADILALTPGWMEDPALLNAEAERLDLASNMGISLDALDQIATQEKRLLHLLHTIEAEQAVDAPDLASDFDDVENPELDDIVEEVETHNWVDEPETPPEPEIDDEVEQVIRPEGFRTDVLGPSDQAEGNAARDLRLDPVRVVDFPSRHQAEYDEGSFDERPAWAVEPRETGKTSGRMFWGGLWDRIRTYPETARLVRLQRDLREGLVTKPVSPRVFDVDLYCAQGSTEPYAEPLHHYLLEGEKAGWSPLAGFDPAYYATQVGELGGWKGSLLRHFLSRGIHDRRSPSKALEGLSDRAAAEDMDPLEYFFHWENAARGTWREDDDDYD